jgi:hypothetical protein
MKTTDNVAVVIVAVTTDIVSSGGYGAGGDSCSNNWYSFQIIYFHFLATE